MGFGAADSGSGAASADRGKMGGEIQKASGEAASAAAEVLDTVEWDNILPSVRALDEEAKACGLPDLFLEAKVEQERGNIRIVPEECLAQLRLAVSILKSWVASPETADRMRAAFEPAFVANPELVATSYSLHSELELARDGRLKRYTNTDMTALSATARNDFAPHAEDSRAWMKLFLQRAGVYIGLPVREFQPDLAVKPLYRVNDNCGEGDMITIRFARAGVNLPYAKQKACIDEVAAKTRLRFYHPNFAEAAKALFQHVRASGVPLNSLPMYLRVNSTTPMVPTAAQTEQNGGTTIPLTLKMALVRNKENKLTATTDPDISSDSYVGENTGIAVALDVLH